MFKNFLFIPILKIKTCFFKNFPKVDVQFDFYDIICSCTVIWMIIQKNNSDYFGTCTNLFSHKCNFTDLIRKCDSFTFDNSYEDNNLDQIFLSEKIHFFSIFLIEIFSFFGILTNFLNIFILRDPNNIQNKTAKISKISPKTDEFSLMVKLNF